MKNSNKGFTQNSFSNSDRWYFYDCWKCSVCGQNGSQSGGLELHHIWGRKAPFTNSILNASLLCKACHDSVGQNTETRCVLFKVTLHWLLKNHYAMKQRDIKFFESVWNEIQLSPVKLDEV